jgi:hypothetical protein
LTENNWDESLAANAHYAQQMSNGGGGGGGQQNMEEPYDENQEDIRAPIQQQHDQLIDDSPFAGLFGGIRPNRPFANSYNEGQNPANRQNNLGDPFLQRGRAPT